jgi:16S rRNA (cytidine1402-2'-O)-methyltransferase
VIVAGMQEISSETEQEALRILGILLESLPLKQAVELASKITGQKKNDIYETALKIKNNS